MARVLLEEEKGQAAKELLTVHTLKKKGKSAMTNFIGSGRNWMKS